MRYGLRTVLVAALLVLAGCTVVVTDSSTSTPSGEFGPVAESSPSAPVSATPTLSFEPADTIRASVTDVVDGDTIDVRLPDGSDDTVRLVGVDTPEVRAENDPAEFEGVPDTEAGARCLRDAGREASAFMDDRLSGADVTLVVDPNTDRRGGYGRLLAYVVHDERNINYELVAQGHARVYDSDFSMGETFYAAENRAQEARRGLWTCRSP
jgi:micrococcal nuclease